MVILLESSPKRKNTSRCRYSVKRCIRSPWKGRSWGKQASVWPVDEILSNESQSRKRWDLWPLTVWELMCCHHLAFNDFSKCSCSINFMDVIVAFCFFWAWTGLEQDWFMYKARTLRALGVAGVWIGKSRMTMCMGVMAIWFQWGGTPGWQELGIIQLCAQVKLWSSKQGPWTQCSRLMGVSVRKSFSQILNALFVH